MLIILLPTGAADLLYSSSLPPFTLLSFTLLSAFFFGEGSLKGERLV